MTSGTPSLDGYDAFARDARSLLSAAAVRERGRRMLALGVEGALDDWTVDLDRLPHAADVVAAVIRTRYRDLAVPLHARWRHFALDGRNLWDELAAQAAFPDPAAKARAAFDLVMISVLLDAGAGSGWRYLDAATGLTASRSEGLALAGLRWLAAGGVSDDPADPLRADAEALERVSERALAAAFQASGSNPLPGLEGRARLLRRFGRAVEGQPDLFARVDAPRPGGLFDALAARAVDGALPAPVILEALLQALAPIWEGRPSLAAVDLGDCWPHPALTGSSPADSFVPLHKLSQWLAYSLIEPLEDAGVRVVDVDGLTGLAEYRNGGLFVDLGVLVPRDAQALGRSHRVGDPFVVGWRGMTVALLDRIAPLVRERLGVSEPAMPLAAILEGGTWAAGRAVARERRADGGPPFQVISDGTVF